jgi:RNA polymerase sigma-70 factor (ECF subfamily)
MALHPDAPLPHTPPDAASAALTDGVLVARVRAGDLAAFELIMRRHNQRLYRLARGILRNGPEAEDVVQETYVRSFEKLADFMGPEGFAAWLGKIVVNEALGRLRKQGKLISLEYHIDRPQWKHDSRQAEAMRSLQPDPERLASSGELRRMIEKAIDQLPEDFRAVFVLRAVEGMSIGDTADYLSIREETVKTRFHRARKQIQEALGAQFDALMPSAFSFAGERCDRMVAAVLARVSQ